MQMKVIDVDRQVRLPLTKTLQLVLSGVRFRLFRAAITVVIVALAVAFLMTMLSDSIITRNVAAAIDVETAPRRLLGFWVNQLTSTMTVQKLTEDLATLHPDSNRWKELKGWGRIEDNDAMGRLVDVAQRKQMYAAFFDNLKEGDRRALVGRAVGLDIFEVLLDDEAFEKFRKELVSVGQLFPGEGIDAFGDFLTAWASARLAVDAIIADHSAAAEQARKTLLKGRPADTFFADEADESLPGKLATFGFILPDDDVVILHRRATLRRDGERIAGSFVAPLLKQSVAKRAGLEKVNEATVDTFFKQTSSRRGVKWFLTELDNIRRRFDELPEDADERRDLTQEQKLILASRDPLAIFAAFEISPERITEVTQERLRDKHLQNVEKKITVTAEGTGLGGFSSRTLALIAVSFLVCIVGIANAMLMSVTERFREIATMKCLGATDGFIMVNFILESCMQGIAGGLIGAIVGMLLGCGRSVVMYGWMAMAQTPFSELAATAVVSFLLGLAISAMAAVYPAWVAARLAPMEAMRIE